MSTDTIVYEVQRMDGTPASVSGAMNLIIFRFDDNPDYKLPKSAEDGFFESAYKTIFNWIVESNGLEKMKELVVKIRELTKDDEIFRSPFAGTGYKYRFAVRLSCMCDMLDVYINSNLYTKTYIDMTRLDYPQPRNLLAQMWKLDRPATKQEVSAMFTEAGATDTDLEYLVNQSVVMERETEIEGETLFELTPLAFEFLSKTKLM